MWKELNNYWLNVARKGNKLIYFLRFEDLIADPFTELESIFKFLLGITSLENTEVGARIEAARTQAK